jgi:sensor histidine kinase YesM
LQIAPMLLIPFIENAFKHGVNSEQDSKIKINIKTNGSELHLLVANNKVKLQSGLKGKSGGLGIENTKHRLALVYPSKHLLTIKETGNDFTVSLHINLL